MRDVLVIQPGFPVEISYFVRALAKKGARVLGIGDQHQQALPDPAKEGLHAYLRVPNIWNADAVIRALREWDLPVKLDQVECLWEPGMELAANIREAFGIPGMSLRQTLLFRDKDLMRGALDKAGIRNPRHARANSDKQILEASQLTGFPLIVKPVAGAGSANTYRIDNHQQLLEILPRLRNVAEVVVEEFIDGTEFTFDTVTGNGRILYHNIALYRPNMLTARSNESLSPQAICLRDLNTPDLQKGFQLGQAVIQALGFQSGFTHMEWFLKPNGEAIFGEIGARPPGGRLVEMMNYACDFDVYDAWAEAVLYGKLSKPVERKYNSAIIFKRAHGQGRIQNIQGVQEMGRMFGDYLTNVDLLPIGANRRDWKQSILSDGFVMLRHPDLPTCIKMADWVSDHLRIYAGH